MRTQAEKTRTRPVAAGAVMTAQRQVAGLPAAPGNSLQSRQLQASQDLLDGSPQAARLNAIQMQAQPNRTGLPDQLKAGIEHLSGMAMDGVRVHYNSARPAQLQALAYAQGNDIHLAPGQERHLPHEAWHVVQQKQGRVRATMQMQAGVAINDDAGLEREADVMGARASAVAQPVAGAMAAGQLRVLSAQHAAPGQLVAQRVVTPIAIEDAGLYGNFVQRVRPVNLKGEVWRLYLNAYGDMNWIPSAREAYQIIADARGVVEDDEDMAMLQKYEMQLNKDVTRGNALVPRFNQAAPTNRMHHADSLVTVRRRINGVLLKLRLYFRPAGGGFGAVGRATEVPGRTVNPGQKNGSGQQQANRFLALTDLNGKNMTATHHVTGAQDAPSYAGSISLQVCGSNNPEVIHQHADVVNGRLGQLTKPTAQKKEAADNFIAVGRGQGQAAAMEGTNARGYAWWYGFAGWDTTQWEWLHVRGAGLGGATNSGNLVLGTRDANTQMMPYESNMRNLQAIAKESADYTGVEATWTVSGPEKPHAYREILMHWEVPPTAKGVLAGRQRLHGNVIIHPLVSTGVLSKAEVRHIEQELLKIREAMRASTAPETANTALQTV